MRASIGAACRRIATTVSLLQLLGCSVDLDQFQALTRVEPSSSSLPRQPQDRHEPGLSCQTLLTHAEESTILIKSAVAVSASQIRFRFPHSSFGNTGVREICCASRLLGLSSETAANSFTAALVCSGPVVRGFSFMQFDLLSRRSIPCLCCACSTSNESSATEKKGHPHCKPSDPGRIVSLKRDGMG